MVHTFIKNSIKHLQLPPIQTEKLQATVIKITLERQLTIAMVYCLPRYSLTTDELEDLFDSLGNYFLVAGDFNVKRHFYGSRLWNPKWAKLLQQIIHRQLTVLPTERPTYWPADSNKVPDTLDFGITNIKHSHIQTTEILKLTSDHSSVSFSTNLTATTLHSRLNVANKCINWENFIRISNDNLTCNIPLKTKYDIEVATEQLTTLVQSAAVNSTHYETNNTEFQYPIHIYELIKLRKKVRKK